tara:strand:- start:629 stop:802 length:174 start_codon:yes stop_codon:yes gene_type:complete
MTAKHFRALADAISKMDLDSNDRDHVAVEVGKVCAEFNSAFKADLFLYWSRGFHKVR